MLDTYERMDEYEEVRNDPAKYLAEYQELQGKVDEVKKRIKAENHQKVLEDHSVLLLGSGDKGTDDPDWRLIVTAEPKPVSEAVNAKLGVGWKVLVSDDIKVTRFNSTGINGKFTIGFTCNGIERYKNCDAIVYHEKADGTVEELKAVWNEAYQCFTVVTDSFSPFVLAVDPANVITGISADSTNFSLIMGIMSLAIVGLGLVLIRRRTDKTEA